MADGDDFNTRVISEFRANAGKVGAPFEGATLLLLHHTGAKTGTERVNPLVYQRVGDSYAIFASAGGQPHDPQWFRNLLANPETTVELGAGPAKVRARVVNDRSQRDTIYARQVEIMPGFGEYEKTAAPRVIPVVLLDPVA